MIIHDNEYKHILKVFKDNSQSNFLVNIYSANFKDL